MIGLKKSISRSTVDFSWWNLVVIHHYWLNFSGPDFHLSVDVLKLKISGISKFGDRNLLAFRGPQHPENYSWLSEYSHCGFSGQTPLTAGAHE